ncbi:MAG: hypothetical protein ACRDF9_06740 [Candidatus Limnocylindria bacterium]
MRRTLMLGAFVAVFAMTGTTALANDNNNGRIGRADPPVTTNPAANGVPCRGLYTAGVGFPPNPGGADPFGRTVGTPGYDQVFENDEEMCHGRED